LVLQGRKKTQITSSSPLKHNTESRTQVQYPIPEPLCIYMLLPNTLAQDVIFAFFTSIICLVDKVFTYGTRKNEWDSCACAWILK
jgi:hypothetical protein